MFVARPETLHAHGGKIHLVRSPFMVSAMEDAGIDIVKELTEALEEHSRKAGLTREEVVQFNQGRDLSGGNY